MRWNVASVSAGIALLTSCLAVPAQAALFDCASEPGYCIGVGDTVIFRYSGSSSSMGLFGTLEVIGDSIVSFPTAFRAESSSSIQDAINDNGTVQVIAKSGYQFDSVTIIERGAYFMSGADSSVNVTGFMEVGDWNDQIFGPYDSASLALNAPLNNRTGTTTSWRMEGTVDLAGVQWDGVNEISLSLVNSLYATGNSGTAWIEKLVSGAGLDVSIQTSVVPVPAAVWLLGSGLVALFGATRHRND